MALNKNCANNLVFSFKVVAYVACFQVKNYIGLSGGGHVDPAA